MVVPHDPDADSIFPDVIKEVIGKPVEIAAAQSIGVEMEESRIGRGLLNSYLKLCEKVVAKFLGNLGVFFKDRVQIILNMAVKPNLHDA